MEANKSQSGFTLLEVLIALAVFTLAFASILLIQSTSLKSTERTKLMNTVTMLAKQIMVKSEMDIQGKSFTEVGEEESNQFDSPYQDFKWTRKIKEVKFPNLSFATPPKEGEEGGGKEEGQNQFAETMTKLVTKFLSKSAREVSVTITWQIEKEPENFTLTTYWVDLNHDFELSE